MNAGNLRAKVALVNPEKVYSSNQHVRGQIVLTYESRSTSPSTPNPHLFGHLKLSVCLWGRAKTKIWKSSGNSSHLYRGRVPLFSRSHVLYNDSFRATPGSSHTFPFSVSFPELVEATTTGFARNDKGLFSDGEAGSPLPQTFQYNYSGFSTRFESFIEYRVGVEVSMPLLRGKVIQPDKYSARAPPLEFEGTHDFASINHQPSKWQNVEFVQSELLLPTAFRPSGFLQKAKAALSPDYYPKFAFDWTCHCPQNIYPLHPIPFKLSIQSREADTNAALLTPQISLSSFQVDLVSLVHVRAHLSFLTEPEAKHKSTECLMRGIDPEGLPFSEANAWTKVIHTPALSPLLIPSFHTANISWCWRLNVRGAFRVVGKERRIERSFAVDVLAPPRDAVSLTPSMASFPSQAGSMDGVEEGSPGKGQPPRYEDAAGASPPAYSSHGRRQLIHASLR